MTAQATTDKCVIDAAETYFAEIETIVADVLLQRTLPTVGEVDDLIARLTGVRVVIADDGMPSGYAEQRGLRCLLASRRADVAGLLEADRDERARGVNSCVEPVATRISAYEQELSGLDDALTRLQSYEALRTVRLACAAVLLHRTETIVACVQSGNWPAEFQAFVDDPANEDKIRDIIAALTEQYGVQDTEILAKLSEVADGAEAAAS